MIVDVHSHIWSNLDQLGREIAFKLKARSKDRLSTFDAGPRAHETAMECVDGALVFGFRADRLNARVPNELIAEFVSVDPQSRAGVAGIDPLNDDAQEQLNAALEFGMVGITVAPACQGFHPSHSSAMLIYERCASLGLPVFVTTFEPLTSSAVLEFARPMHWDEVALAFPDLPIVIGQLGFPWIDETLVMLGKHANVYADISGVISRPWQLYNSLVNATSLGVMDKLLFASGFPFETPAKAIESLYSVNSFAQGTRMPTVPRSLLRSIVERDALGCLGIEAEFGTRARTEKPDGLSDVERLLGQRGLHELP